jgi:hypothetical protein
MALVVLICGWFVSGMGMGIAHPRFSASAMDELPSDRMLPVAIAVSFSERSANRRLHRRRDLFAGPIPRTFADQRTKLGFFAPRRLRCRVNRAVPAALARAAQPGAPTRLSRHSQPRLAASSNLPISDSIGGQLVTIGWTRCLAA